MTKLLGFHNFFFKDRLKPYEKKIIKKLLDSNALRLPQVKNHSKMEQIKLSH